MRSNALKRSLRRPRGTRGARSALSLLCLLALLTAGIAHVVRSDARAEVADGIDWARGATTSMAPATGASQPAALAIDGDLATAAVTGGRTGTEPYLQLDLESATRIATVRVRSSSSPLWLVTGDERGIPGSTLAQATGAPGVTVQSLGNAANGVTVTVNAGVRYLRVMGQVSANISIAEVAAFTDPAYVYVVDPGDRVVTTGSAVDITPTGYAPGALTWTARGLPRAFAIDPATGRITGSSTVSGRWRVEVTATHAASGRSHTAKFDLVQSPGAPGGAVQEHPAVDPSTLSNRPTETWGVIGANARIGISGGNPSDSTPSLDVTVWDMQQLGDWMYVGGEFNRVIAPDGTTYPQAFLTRFAVATGEWDASWRPRLDGNVHALEVSDRGRLLVGGEFSSIDGVAGTQALAAIDPRTGTVDTSFAARVERSFSSQPPIVRELEVVGRYVYIGGKFSHIVNGTTRTRVHSVARVSNGYGSVDPTWAPRVAGGSVWGIGVDQQNGLVHLAGWFSSVDGQPGTNRIATVDTTTGDLATTTAPARNATQVDVYDVEAGNGALFLAGSEHVLVRMEPLTRAILGWQTSGYVNPWTYPARWSGGGGLGGDFQFAEKIGDFLFSGCHCNRRVSNAHWSSISQEWSDHVVVQAYRVSDGDIVAAWNPDVGGGVDGGWTAATDTAGCVWVGGDIVDGSFYQPGGRVFARGFARFCGTGTIGAPTGLTATAADDLASVTVAWEAPAPASGLKGYFVYRDGGRLGWVPAGTTSYVDGDVRPGATHVYEVRSEDQFGRTSSGNPTVTILIGGEDTTPPSVPADLAVTVGPDSAALTWSASTDDRSLSGYLVYRGGTYLGWSPSTSYTDTGLAPGAYSYEVRAVDLAGNRSDKSAAVTAQVGGADTTPPSVPADLAVTAGPDSATLTWTASTDDRAVTTYLVYRDGAYLGWTATPGYTDAGLAPASHTYEVRAVDAAGNRSDKSAAVTVQIGAPDTTAPSVPADLVATAGTGQADLTWTASTDDRALSGYLIYRDGAYLAFTTATSYTDAGVSPGTHTYALRAVDVAGNRSDKTAEVAAAVL